MSTTPSSSPNKTSAVTPPSGQDKDKDTETSHENPIESFRFETKILDMIVDLLTPNADATSAVRTGLDNLFSNEWDAKNWNDLGVFSAADVNADIQASDGAPPEIKSKVIIKKLGYIIEFAHFGMLTPELTMTDVISAVDGNRGTGTTKKAPGSPSRKSVTVFDKNSVPELNKFSGNDEDYFEWRESTIDKLGSAGCFDFLVDEAMAGKHPSMSQSVFFSLRGAVRGGHAQSIAQALVDDKRNTPMALWSELESYYNTALNRANVVLFNIRRLISLRLTPDVAPTTFINDFKDCLQRLRKNNARLSEDNDTLRALFLLVAIQDDDFDGVRDAIVQKPQSEVKDILNEIRERTQSLKMKDQAATNGESGSRYSRRVQKSSESSSLPNTKDNAAGKKWNIPRIPEGWQQSFGKAVFKLILDWRSAAHKGHTQQQLNTEFNTVDEKVHKKPKSSQDATNGSDTTSTRGSTGGAGGDTSSKEPQRKRIRLQKSRRVITERPT
jgi:hypothetical protein